MWFASETDEFDPARDNLAVVTMVVIVVVVVVIVMMIVMGMLYDDDLGVSLRYRCCQQNSEGRNSEEPAFQGFHIVILLFYVT
jgi:heme/copper-type cytochrome/quinol oxidase subunit 2